MIEVWFEFVWCFFYHSINMVKWKNLWLTKRDSNNVIIGLWATKKDARYAKCSLCSCDLKYSTQGFHTFTQHSIMFDETTAD